MANPPPIRWVRPADAPPPDSAQFLEHVLRRHHHPKYTVGASARYSNLGYLALARVIEITAGRPFTDVVRELVLDPAGMHHTGYAYELDRPHATGYLRCPRVLGPALTSALPTGIVGEQHGSFRSFREFLVNGAGYGGLVGDIRDASRLAALHLGDGTLDGRRVLAAETAKRMRTITTPGKPFDLGLGWFRRPSDATQTPGFVEHLGSGGGYCNLMRIYPDLDLGIVIMTNTTRAYHHSSICGAAVATFGSSLG